MCDELYKDSNVAGWQTAAERHSSSTVRELAREGDLESAVDLFKKLKMGGHSVSPLLCNCGLEAYVDVVSYNTLPKAYLNARVTFNELLHARILANDMDGTWKILDHMNSANIAVNAVTCSILFRCGVFEMW